MSPSRKNFSQGYKIVKEDFQRSVENLFEKQHHGSKCTNRIFIKASDLGEDGKPIEEEIGFGDNVLIVPTVPQS